MTVSGITELDKKRCRIYLDGEFAFVLYKGELKDYCIREGQELSQNAFDEITRVLLPKRAKLRAMNLLQKKDYTKKQLTDKLSEGLYPSEVIEEAIKYVESYKYLDDERFARDYIAYHMSTRSRNRIIQDLSSKGISKDVFMPVLEELYEEEGDDSEMDQIRKLLQKKHYDPENTEFKDKQKIIAFLMRRGFNMSDIRKAMEE